MIRTPPPTKQYPPDGFLETVVEPLEIQDLDRIFGRQDLADATGKGIESILYRIAVEECSCELDVLSVVRLRTTTFCEKSADSQIMGIKDAEWLEEEVITKPSIVATQRTRIEERLSCPLIR